MPVPLQFSKVKIRESSPEGISRDLRIVFFVQIESRIESAIRFVFEWNLRIESAVYHASRNTA